MAVSPYSLIASAVTAGGTGYTLADTLTLADGSVGVHSVSSQVTVAGVASGVVTAVVPAVLGSYSILPSSPVSVTGGTGTGCTLTPLWGALFALPADLQQRYDWHEIGDLVSDSNEQISALDQITLGKPANTLLLQLLSDASGDIEAALLVAGRYATTDLSALTGNSLSLLKRLTCELAIAYLYERKPFWKPERLEAYGKAKEGHLKRLADGINVFNLPLVVTAGNPEITGPSTLEYENLNLITRRAKGYPAQVLPNFR